MSVLSSGPVPTREAGIAPAQSLPLTEAQEGLWYAQRLDPSNPIYNTGHCTQIRGPLDLACFERAVNTALAEADALALRFLDLPEGPRQYMDPAQRPVLETVDLSQVAQGESRARHLMRQDLATAIDPTASPLARHMLFVAGPDHFLWYQRIHHLAADGYGMALIEARVTQLYAAYVDGQSHQGEPLTSFGSVLTEDAQYRDSPKRDADRDFWLNDARHHPPALSLTNGAPMTSRTFLYAMHPASPELLAALRRTEAESGVSWPDILTALCTAYISRHIRQSETIVGVPFMGRLGSVSARSVATVMNVAPLRVVVEEDLALTDYLKQVQRTLRKTRRHGRYRSEQLRRDLGLLGGNRRLHGPIINVLPFDTPYRLPGLTASQTVLCAGPVEDLTFTFRARPDAQGLRLEVEANPRHYQMAEIQAHLLRLERFIGAALNAASLATVPTLTAAEERHWIHAVNNTAHPVPQTHLWPLIETAIHRFASNSALEFGAHTLTYAQMDAQSNALAQRLRAAGVQRNDIVALALPRSIELVLALVALARVGAAYLPLDFEQPFERIRHIIASATPRLTLAVGSTHGLLPADCATLLLDDERAAGRSDAPVAPHAGDPSDAAYVIYTSGSTGDPKGVVVSHDAIVNRLLWMQDQYGISPDDRILQKTPATFDVSVWEFFLPLISGATLVVAPPAAHKDPAWLVRLIRDQRITTLHFVPSMLAAFLDESGLGALPLRRVFCSGEELPAALRDRFHQHVQAELHNLYGPTEAAVDVTYWPATATDTSEPVPIGFPVWNTAMYVLDERLRPLPAGVPGHLYIAGRQLAQGYLGRADLTAERFIADPFQVHGATMYLTGDIAQWREDGALVFLGRSDHQIKLRGQRIELGEIEAVLAGAPGVHHVAVIAREDTPGNMQIVAYLVGTSPGAGVDADVLGHAAAQLPDYMLPAALVWLDTLPVTVNGKLNRKALPAPRFQSKAGRPPVSNNEIYVAGLFTHILERPALGANDDFFDLGGHSLLAARLALQVRSDRGYDFTLGALFEHPTVARLAAYLDDLDEAKVTTPTDGFGPVITLRTGPAEKAPLFCIHPAGGLSWCYGTLARALQAPRTVYGMQAPALGAKHRTSPADLATMASGYVDTLLTLQEQGPYHLAGWSVGGIIAHAMATELQRRGHRVGVLAMLDAYPSDSWKNQPPPPPDAVYKALLHIAGHDPDTLPDVALTRAGVIGFLRRTGHPLGELSDWMLEGVFDVVANNNLLVRSHRHDAYRGRVLYFRAALDHEGEDLFPEHWAPYVGSLDVHDIPSLHAHLTGPDAMTTIAPALDAHMADADAGHNTDKQR